MRSSPVQILLVEDQEDHIGFIRKALDDSREYNLNTASSLNDAREFLNKNKYDIILTGIRLKDGKGVELLEKPEILNIPLIIITSIENESEAAEAIETGAFDYIVKSDKTPGEIRRFLKRALTEWDNKKEQKQAGDSIRESERRYRELVENASIGIALIDTNGNLIEINNKLLAMLGSLLKKTAKAFNIFTFKPLVKAGLSDAVKKCISENKPQSIEHYYTYKQTEPIYVSSNLTPVHNTEGKITGIQINVTNITAKKQTEDELIESKRVYSMLVDESHDGIIILQDGMLKFTNPMVAQISGYTQNELKNRNIKELFLPEYLEIITGFTDKLISEQNVSDNIDVKAANKNGEIIDLEISGKVVKYRGKPAVLYVIRRITERQQILKALLESEKKYRTLQENLPVGIFRSTPEGKFKFVNQAMAKILGFDSKEELLNCNPIDLWTNPEERKKLLEELKSKHFITNYEGQYKKKDGTTSWISYSMNAEFDKNGEIQFMGGILKNIDERKKVEAALRKNEALYSALFHHNPIQTVVVDKQCKIIALNKAKTESGDRLPRLGDIMYKDYAASHNIDMHKELFECISLERMREFPEQPYKNKILSIKISPFGEGAIITSQDITLQKQAEINLRKSEEKYRLVTDNMLDMVSMCNAKGEFSFISPSHELVLGYTQDELMDKNIYQYIHPDDVLLVTKQIETHNKKHGTASITYRHRHKDGHYVWLETYSHSIKNADHKYIGAVLSSRDITSRRKAEEKIEHLNELLIAIRDVNQLITHEKNTVRLIDGVSECLARSRGHTDVWIGLIDGSNKIITASESGLGRSFLTYLKKQKDISSLSCVKKALSMRKVVTMNCRDEQCCDYQSNPEHNSEGRMVIRLEYNKKIYGILNVGVLKDFIGEEDEHSLLEEVAGDIAFGLYNTELEKERKELQKQLYRSARLSAVGQLAAGIAHEFNNLLSVILGHTQLSLEEDSIDEIKQSLKEIEKTTKRGSGIVIKLAAFAKPKEPDFKSEDISRTIDEVLQMQKRQLLLENIKIERKYYSNSKVSFDRGQMEQVFLNLLINSMHAIKPKGKGKIVITVKDVYKNLEIRFSDNGIGMDKAAKDKIFDPFYTTKGAWAKDSLGISGTGLGLSIVHSIIKQHNGTITSKSTKNKGTTFIINIPLKSAIYEKNIIVEEQKQAYNSINDSMEKIKDMRILLVDDEDEMTELFIHLFKKAGFENIKTENKGEKAVSIFKKFKPDIVFLDIIMPEMNGEQIFNEIKSLNANIPIVFMSGKIDLKKDRYIRKGAFDIIQKPFEINQIFNILNKVT